MNKKNDGNDKTLPGIIQRQAARKAKSRQDKRRHLWFGFSVFGVIGWSVAIPCLLGAALGLWLDDHYPRQQPWTLALLLAGLCLGCVNAWNILEKQRGKIKQNGDDKHD
jgi:ATP synthase protein I